MDGVNEVFLYTGNSDTFSMVGCLRELLGNFPDIKITSVTADKNFLGFRVRFSGCGEEEVLVKKKLSVLGQDFWICQLTTCLTIHNVRSTTAGAVSLTQVENDICEAVRIFGEPIYATPIYDPQTEGVASRDWRVILDVPEIPEQPFSRTFVELRSRREKLKVSFFCRRCWKDGHVQQVCPQFFGKVQPRDFQHENSTEDNVQMDCNDSRSSSSSDLVSSADFRVLSSKNVMHFCKRADEASIQSAESFQLEGASSVLQDISKKDSTSTIPERNTWNNFSLNNDTTPNRNAEKPFGNFFHSNPCKNAAVGSFFSSSISAAPGPSRAYHRTPISTAMLSPRLQHCIDKACEFYSVLDRNSLEAFFIHVKGKSHPSQEAVYYTKNMEGLSEQLKCIVNLHYTTQEKGTNEDKQFLKWLKDLINRFETIVPKIANPLC